MDSQIGLRELKRQRTHRAISEAAIDLFLASGFDQVTIAQIAEAAEVSRRTLFAYFPTKEDLVMHRFADHEDEPARVVRGRAGAQSPLDALHHHLLRCLDLRDPNTGLNDQPEVVAFLRLVTETASLSARLLQYLSRSMAALSEALIEAGCDPLTARLAAAELISTQRVLADDNRAVIAGGATAGERYPEAVAAANHAYELLGGGLAHRLGSQELRAHTQS